MPDVDAAYEALKNADLRDEVAYTCYLCELYLQDHPNHAPTLVRYANNLIALRQYSAAAKALDSAEACVSEKKLHYVLAQRGHLLMAKGNFPAAEKLFLQAHHLEPNDATYLIYAGSAAFNEGDIDRSEALYRQAIVSSEGCIEEAYFNLGGCMLSKREYHEAAGCYRKALEIDSNYKVAQRRLADVNHILERLG